MATTERSEVPTCRLCRVDHEPGSPDCPHSRVGSTVAGKYRLDKLLGVGGMGAVFEAENIALQRRVALKLLHAKLASDAQSVERFQREARGVAKLNHPGFTQVFACDTAPDGTMYIEMELLVGASVDAIVKSGPVPIPRAIAILDSALDAMAAAHVAGFVHRDIKPENLFVCRDQRGAEYVEVLDFGIARSLQANETRLTTTGEFMGTVLYASPEQLMDASSTDARSDVFSLGATAYELLVGESPAAGGSYAEIISRIMVGDHLRSPKAKRGDVPDWLDEMIVRCLEMEPAKRYVHAGVMLDQLRALVAAAAAKPAAQVEHDPWNGPAFQPHVPPPPSGLATPNTSLRGTMLGVSKPIGLPSRVLDASLPPKPDASAPSTIEVSPSALAPTSTPPPTTTPVGKSTFFSASPPPATSTPPGSNSSTSTPPASTPPTSGLSTPVSKSTLFSASPPPATSTPPATAAATSATSITASPGSEHKKWMKLGIALAGVVLVIVIVAVAASGGGSPAANVSDPIKGSAKSEEQKLSEKPNAAFPGSEDGARLVIMELRTNKQLVRSLAPEPADYAAIFEGAAAQTAAEHYKKMYASSDVDLKIDSAQTETLVSRATTEEIRQGKASEFPGGYRNIGDQLKPGLVFYRWKYVRPGETMGMAFDGLVHVNGHWVWVPKPFRALR